MYGWEIDDKTRNSLLFTSPELMAGVALAISKDGKKSYFGKHVSTHEEGETIDLVELPPEEEEVLRAAAKKISIELPIEKPQFFVVPG